MNVFGRPAATTAAVSPLTRTLTLTRVVFVCWLQYIVDLAVPEAQWIKPEIANGEHVDWLRICGWMTTSPVLILFLVSMTTVGGREASVRVVPFLVANQAPFSP